MLRIIITGCWTLISTIRY